MKASEFAVHQHVQTLNYKDELEDDYQLAVNDEMTMIIFSNKGEHKLLNLTVDQDASDETYV